MPTPLAGIYRNLGHLHGAGIPWPEAIREGTPRDDPRWVAVGMALARGISPSTALAPLVPPLDRAGLRAGEASGRMEQTLVSLAERHEVEDRRARERRTALTYPVFVAHVAALLLPFPDFFAGRRLAALGWCLAVLVPTWTYLLVSLRVRRAQERGDALPTGPLARLVRTPAFVEEADARTIAALGWLHESGVPPLEALPLAAAAGLGGRASEDLRGGEALVRAGQPVSTAWRRVPSAEASRLTTGEATGHLGEACASVAAELAERAEHRRKRFDALLKPIAILLLGAVIGARVISYYLTMYRMAGLLK